ncbi:MAG TPA: type II toxin-antitoxin system VapC family toxin [Gaiellaceae bacterium]|nr:type II toxin-antitoxin system VapC family toxin [Gaiellaceae bacterium]
MTVYAEASALLKLYLDEVDSDVARGLLRGDPEWWVSTCVTAVEVRRSLTRLLVGEELVRARSEFRRDWSDVVSIAVDDATSDRVAQLAEATEVRTLDALHLEAAERAGAGDGLVSIVSFDVRLAEAARSLGWTVLGA